MRLLCEAQKFNDMDMDTSLSRAIKDLTWFTTGTGGDKYMTCNTANMFLLDLPRPLQLERGPLAHRFLDRHVES
jgi:hypothetical protein